MFKNYCKMERAWADLTDGDGRSEISASKIKRFPKKTIITNYKSVKVIEFNQSLFFQCCCCFFSSC